MASIRTRKGPKGTSHQVVYRDASGRQRVETYHSPADAKRRKAEVETDLNRGVWRDPEAGKTSFEDVFNDWLDGRRADLAPSTWALYESIGIKYVAGEFAEHRIGDIRPVDVRAWIAELAAEGRSRSLIGTARLVLREVCAQAVMDDLIPTNPVVGSKMPRAEHTSDKRVLLPEEVEAIADAIDGRYRPLVLVGGYCGLRLGEALGLRWKRIDVLARTITVREQLDRTTLQLASLKTRASRRVVPIPAFVADELAAIAPSPADPEALVFTTATTGAPIRDGNFRRRVWTPALERAGVAPAKFHDLRHHCAGFAISLGAHPKEIAAMLGHSGIRVTLDVYGDLFPSLATGLADRMNDARQERGIVTALPRSS